jgi:hypothetical protein
MKEDWWSDKMRLSEIDSLDGDEIPEFGVYKIWNNNCDDGILKYIGQGRCENRLKSHRGDVTKSEDYFSAAEVPKPARGSTKEAKKRRLDIEIELIGAHYISQGSLPKKQEGYSGTQYNEYQSSIHEHEDSTI